MFQVSRPYLGFCPDPKHFIVNCEQNVVKFAEKWGKIYWKMQFLYKIFWLNKMLCPPTIPSFFQSWNLKHTYIFFWLYAKIWTTRFNHSVMHQSFVTPAPTRPMGNSGDNNFSSIKALHCGDLLRVITLLFIIVNSTGVYLCNITSPAFTLDCGGNSKGHCPAH